MSIFIISIIVPVTLCIRALAVNYTDQTTYSFFALQLLAATGLPDTPPLPFVIAASLTALFWGAVLMAIHVNVFARPQDGYNRTSVYIAGVFLTMAAAAILMQYPTTKDAANAMLGGAGIGAVIIAAAILTMRRCKPAAATSKA